MNLNSYKHFFVRYTPHFFSESIIMLWRGPLTPIRTAISVRRFKKEIPPYYKKISHNGLKIEMYVDVAESWVSREVDLRGIHEEHILEKIIGHLPIGGVFVDVGANVGQHSLFAAAKVGSTGKVFAFEPIPSSAEQIRLSKNRNNFNWLTIIQKAVSDSAGKIDFYKYGLSDISSRNLNFIDRPAEKIQVEMTTLDTEIKNIGRIDCIKIDVEGYEMDVLNGAKEIINKHKPVIILEYSPVFYEKLNQNDSIDIFTFLLDTGYSITDIDNLVGKISSVSKYREDLKKAGNISNILCIYEK